MPQTLWLRAAPNRPVEWLVRDPQGRIVAGPELLRADSVLPSADSRIAIWSDPSLMLRRVELPKSGLAKWRQGLPYLAEDWIAGDVAQVHVAAPTRLTGRDTLVAVADRERLVALLSELAQFGIDVDRLVPEPALLGPTHAADVLIDAQYASFCNAEHGGTTETDMLAMLVDPNARILIGRTPHGEWHGDGIESVLRWASLQRIDDTTLDLRCGEFAKTRRESRFPKMPVLALAAALLVHTLALVFDWYQLRGQVATAEVRIETAFRDAFGPDERMVDPAFQLQQAARGEASTSHAGALALLQRIAPVLSGSRMVLVSFEYREGVLELAVRAPDASQFDGFREQLVSSGLSIEMGNTQYDANEFTGRLKIRSAG